MSKPIIGVMPLWDDEKNSMWMLPGYFEGISQAGGVPIMLPLSVDKDGLDQLIEMCDGFLFSGGHDVSPEIYNEKPLDNLVSSCIRRDEMEAYILKKAIEIDKPIFGICRGIQFINAALGGSLYQDLPTQHKSEVEHHQTPPYDIPVHKVKIVKDSPLYKYLNTELLEVNIIIIRQFGKWLRYSKQWHYQKMDLLKHSISRIINSYGLFSGIRSFLIKRMKRAE